MIKINNVTKKFGEKIVFKNLNLQIEEKELIAITGGSGCGKTTLMNIIGLIDNEYEGEVMYNDVNIANLSKSKKAEFIRDNINYLFQSYALIDDQTVRENLLLALYYMKMSKDEKTKSIDAVLNDLGLAGLSDKKIYTLSGGEQQRVALARVMLKKGDIILADEPTGNLDAINRDIVLNKLIELNNAEKTVIIITHDNNIVKQCHRIIDLSNI